VFNRAAARRLASGINSHQSGGGGTALVTTSPRTRNRVARALGEGLRGAHYFHVWSKDAPNPYRAILALADEFIVTGDSVSMLADACRTGKPVAVFELPMRCDPVTLAGLAISSATLSAKLPGRLLRQAAAHGILSPPRAISRVHETLFSGLAAVKFEPGVPIREAAKAVELDLGSRSAILRVQALVEQVARSAPSSRRVREAR